MTANTEVVHTIRYEQRDLGGNPWVAAFDAALRVPSGKPATGKVLQDTGDYFAIRFPSRGVYVYRRVRDFDTGGKIPFWDHGVVVMVLP